MLQDEQPVGRGQRSRSPLPCETLDVGSVVVVAAGGTISQSPQRPVDDGGQIHTDPIFITEVLVQSGGKLLPGWHASSARGTAAGLAVERRTCGLLRTAARWVCVGGI